MKSLLVAVGFCLAAGSAFAEGESEGEGVYYDFDGGTCNKVNGDNREFYAFFEEGVVDVFEERRAYIGGRINEQENTKSGLVQMFVVDDQNGYVDKNWYTFDPKRGYIAEGRLTDPNAVKDQHLMTARLKACHW